MGKSGSGGASNLDAVLTAGNSAGANDIDMNNNDILQLNNINNSLYFDRVNNRLGINVPAPTEDLEIDGNFQLNTGATARVIFYDAPNDHAHAEIDAGGEGTNGGNLQFWTKEDGGAVERRVCINNAGAIGIGDPTDYGTTGQVLTSNGTGAIPSWEDSAGGVPIYTNATRPATGTLGEVISNTDTGTLQRWDGSAWVNITTSNFPLQFVLIAGGGGGGVFEGGGGAGGYISSVVGEDSGGGSSAVPFSAVSGYSYPVDIGIGGTGGEFVAPSTYIVGTGNGTDSIFGGFTAIGGGRGDNSVNSTGLSGGSGGAGGSSSTASGTTNQGYASGSGGGTTYQPSGAGGGGGVGANWSAGQSGNGGIGVQSSITGVATYRAGGGGSGGTDNPSIPHNAGTGGLGGGGNGGFDAVGQDGGLNTGGGGGGGGLNTAGNGVFKGGTGGDGVLILRYKNYLTISQTGLTMSTPTPIAGTDDVYVEITAGTGNVSWN